LVYNFPPVVAALIPPVLFFMLGVLMMRRVQ
jgi:lipopolysaccharide export LptBFGC system permease protein LptF